MVWIATMCACSSNNMVPSEALTKAEYNKLGVSSKMKLNEICKNDDEIMNFTAMLEKAPNDEMLAEMKEANVEVQSKVGKILTGKANTAAMYKLLKMQYVKTVEINGKVQIFEE